MNNMPCNNNEMVSAASQSLCPFCAQWVQDYDDLLVDAGTVTQKASCHTCGKAWFEVYRMTEIIEA